MFKRAGIVTMYFNSVNYGGLLQAYALCKVINKYLPCEQIQYDNKRFKHRVINCVRSLQYVITHIKSYIRYGLSFQRNNLKRRKKVLLFAKNYIPHSTQIYSRDNVEKTNQIYDLFVCGSDQVWCSRDKVYYLDFVKSHQKYAYACSTGKEDYTKEENALFKEMLNDFEGLSVRELQLSEHLSKLLGKNIDCVIDPTLLLSRSDWDSVCSKKIIEEDYLFCYFLGDDIEHRRLAKEYAEYKGMKIVTLPHLQQKINCSDIDFGDYQLYEVDPLDFVSLVKHANCVMTDSFHASVFSCIYEKQFFVYERSEYKGMSSRIGTLIELFGCRGVFCNEERMRKLSYLKSYKVDYDRKQFKELYDKSLSYIENQIVRGVKCEN